MISISNLTVTFNGSDLFSDVTFMINPKDKIGLVGRNGAGKSTLLKIIKGLQQPTSGQVALPDSMIVGYLPQVMKIADSCSVLEETLTVFEKLRALQKEVDDLAHALEHRTDYESPEYLQIIHQFSEKTELLHLLGEQNCEGDAVKMLTGLGFKHTDLQRPTKEFSGGWRMRIELAKILLQKPQLLLLDEPTNHLDIESIQWLENYLKEYNGALVLISHDRAFLDNITRRTIELVLGKAVDYNVSYSQYVVLRDERRRQQLATFENQQSKIAKTEEFIERFRYKATKSNQVQSRIKMLEKIDRVEVDDEDRSVLHIKFPPAPHSGKVVVVAKEVGKQFGNKVIFSNAEMTIEKGEKVALVGRNGEGKTTMSRMIVGELPYERGELTIGHNVNIGYFAQNQDDLLNGNFTVYDTLDRIAVGEIRTRLRDILGAFLFRGDDIDKKVSVLSGGERSRLAMARLMLTPHNCLVLDEPTNHMDIRAKDILKQALLQFEGTLIVVSHDRDFLDGLVNKIYEFRDGRVKEHLGTIWDFMQRRNVESMKEIEMPVATIPVTQGKNEKSLPDEQSREQQKEIRRLQKEMTQLENNIASIEQKIADCEQRLSENSKIITDSDFSQEYEQLKKDLENRYLQWEEMSQRIEAVE